MERNDHHQTHQQVVTKSKQHGSSSSSLPSHQPPKEITFTNNNQNPSIVTTPTNDSRLKRDEWSEGAVSTLLEAYEAKWTLRNRAKLKGQDWEEVAKHVSARGNGSKSAKTQTQCKNKIESMKKRYRSESAAVDGSSWPLYPRLDLLLRGNNIGTASTSVAPAEPAPAVLTAAESPPVAVHAAVETVAPAGLELGSSTVAVKDPADANGGDHRLAKEEGDGTNNDTKLINKEFEKNQVDDTDSSTPTLHTEKEKSKTKPHLKMKSSERKEKAMKRKREESSNWEIGESIRWLAEVVVRSEQARMDTMREIERMRIEAEAKRSEMELKRTEIIANTQLQIAKLFAKGSSEDWKKMT